MLEVKNFDCFLEILSSSFGVHKYKVSDPQQFSAKLSRFSYSKLDVSNFEISPYRAEIVAETLSLPSRPEKYAVHLALSGGFRFDQDGKQASCDVGEMAVLDTRVKGSTEVCRPTSGVIVSVPIRTWEALAPSPFLQGGYLLRPDRPLVRLARHLVFEMSQSGPGVTDEYQATLSRQLVELVALATTELSDNVPSSVQSSLRVMRIKQFIKNELSNPRLSLYYIADHSGISVRYLSKLFAEESQTVMEYIWSSRLIKAAELVSISRNTKMQIKEISYMCGYKNASHFSKSFSKRFGVAPLDYKTKPEN